MTLQRALAIFKAFRIIIFTICMLLSIGCATILCISLVHESNEFDLTSRLIVLVLTILQFLGAIVLYLMIVVRLRVWLDIARVSFYSLFVAGGAVLFLSGRAKLPCTSSGIGKICSQTTLSVIIGNFTISGLLLLYSIVLGIFACAVPGPLRYKAPADILEDALATATVDSSRRSLIPSANKDWSQNPRGSGNPSRRHHAPEPLNLANGPTSRSYHSPALSASSTASLMLASPMTTESPMIPHPYNVVYAGKPLSPFSSPYRGQFSPAVLSSPRSGYPLSPSPVSSIRSLSQGQISRSTSPVRHPSPLGRSDSAGSVPPHPGVPLSTAPRQSLQLPNPFQEDPAALSSTPSTPRSTVSTPKFSLSFGNRGFPLPPTYDSVSPWSENTNIYLKTYTATPPSTPFSLKPGIPSSKQTVASTPTSASLTQPPRPLSFGSLAASLHSVRLPTPPLPTAHLPRHPHLQAHLDTSSSMSGKLANPVGSAAIPLIAVTTPTSAQTFGAQLLPTDIASDD